MNAQAGKIVAAVCFGGLVSAFQVGSCSAQTLMLQPASASTNMGHFGTYDPVYAIDESGLSATYVSGVTEFDTFVASTHTVSGGSSFTTWFSQTSTTGNFDFDLGGSFSITAMAIWADPQGIGQTVNEFTLLADDNPAFTSPTNLGTFSANDGSPNPTNFGQAFTFTPTVASYVRMVIISNHGSSLTTGFVEAAFGVGEGEEPCLADTNGDGVVSPADFSAWVAAFNAMSPACDQNGDGACSPADFSAWVSNYNAGC